MNTNKVQNPDMKTGSTAKCTPSDNAATVAIKGEIARISQDTLLGLIDHPNVDLI